MRGAVGAGLDFHDRVVVVTGAAHGIGREIALSFAGAGAHVHAWDILESGVEETARLGGDGGAIGTADIDGWIGPAVVDVTDPAQVESAVANAEASSRDGQIHVLVNCAGGVLGQTGRPVEDVLPGEWDAIVRVNMTACFLTAHAAVPAMKENGFGRIVNISSGAGLTVSKTGIQAYAAAKAGQIGLTRQLAHELGPHGITVNAVAPGFVRSNPDTERQWMRLGAEGQEALVQGIALRRLGRPEDIASAVLFLASEQAGWITGQVLPVDGGK